MFIIACLFGSMLTSRAEDTRPNILFVVGDDVSHLSVYGHTFVNTPHLDTLAARGLLFNRMYTPSSKCAPSRAVMITGRNPWQLEGAANHKPVWPEKFKSVVEALTDHGYFSGFTGKGWSPGIHPKNRNLTGLQYNSLKIEPTSLKVSEYDYAANFEKFLADKPEEQPFFFWYGSKEAHRGYEYKSGVKAGKKLEDLDFLPPFWPNSEKVRHDILDYAVEVEYFDQHLGRILDHLAEKGELHNTFIIATSDNSMPFPRYKGHPHEYSTRVPFIINWPDNISEPGRECNEFASFIDIAPTFLEVAKILPKASGMQELEGQSLFDFIDNKVTGRDEVLTGRERNDMCRPNGWGYPVRSYHKGDFVYMHNFEPDRWPSGTEESGYRDTDWSPTKFNIIMEWGESSHFSLCFGKRPLQELYNVKDDPFSINNLASNPEYAAKMEKMKTALFTKLTEQKDPRATGIGKVFDEYRPERIPEYDEIVEATKKTN